MNKLGQDVTIPIGYNIEGNLVTLPINKAPHILIAGCTGSGVTNYVDSIIASMLCRYSTNELRLVLFDPRNSDLVKYDKIPHVLFGKAITDASCMISILQSLIYEMESRYQLLMNGEKGVFSDITLYNSKVDEKDKLPRIIVVINEFTDLMVVNKNKFSSLILCLAQKARAVGIHLILATDNLSIANISSTIKCNLPTRIAFKTKTGSDSLTILSEIGAEKLSGQGDCLFRGIDSINTERLQTCYIASKDIEEVINKLKI